MAHFFVITNTLSGSLIYYHSHLSAFNLGLFNRTQIHAFHRAFCFSYKVNMLHCSLLERYCPVRCIVPNRSRNLETARQFSIYNHFVVQIHVFCKFSFYRFFCCSIGKYIVLHIFLGKIRLRKVFIFFSCKYFRIIGG